MLQARIFGISWAKTFWTFSASQESAFAPQQHLSICVEGEKWQLNKQMLTQTGSADSRGDKRARRDSSENVQQPHPHSFLTGR